MRKQQNRSLIVRSQCVRFSSFVFATLRMSIFGMGIICIQVLLLMNHLSTTSAQECDFTFNIPSLVDSVLNVEEKSNVSFNFTFGSTLCRIADSHVISLAKHSLTKLDDSKSKHTVCKILHVNNQCRTKPPCRCFTQSGLYGVNKVFDRTDITTWILWEDKTHRQKIFNISKQEVTTEAGLTKHTGSNSLSYTPIHGTTRGQSSDSSGELSRTVDPTRALLTMSETSADVSESPPVERSVNITQFIALIAAFAAIAIAIVACRRVGRGRKRIVINRGHQTSFSMRASRRSCREGVTSNTDESNYYLVVDVAGPLSSSSSEAPKLCLRPAMPGSYLHPAESREVIERTDGAENVLPFYGNSTLRAVRSAGDLLDNVVNPTSSVTPEGRNHYTAGNCRHLAKNPLAHYNSLPVVHYTDASSTVLPAIREVSKTSQNQETAAHVGASVRDAAKGFLRSAQTLPRRDLSLGYVQMSGRVTGSLPTRRKFGNNMNIAMSETSEYTTVDDYLTPTAALLSGTAAATESRDFNVLPHYENSVLRPTDSDDSDSFPTNLP